MLYWNNTAWVKVAAGSNGQTLAFYNDAPVWIGTTANSNTVLNPTTGKIWMDRNLGATQVATSSTDYLAYGDLYQWGRGADGHQLITWTDATTGTAVNSTTTTPSSADVPGNANFILTSGDWRSPKNDNLWQGVNGINNPCPSGYRLPTDAEWVTEHASWISQNAAGAFASSLKFPAAGYRVHNDGSLFLVGNTGHYWSSTVSGVDSRMLYFYTGGVPHYAVNRARGYSVRCLKD